MVTRKHEVMDMIKAAKKKKKKQVTASTVMRNAHTEETNKNIVRGLCSAAQLFKLMMNLNKWHTQYIGKRC